MLGITDLKTGTAIDMQGDPCVVLAYQHSKMGRGGAVLRTKLRNIRTGAVIDITFKGSDKFEEAALERRVSSFLYSEADSYIFMDSTNFEQYQLSTEILGDKIKFLK